MTVFILFAFLVGADGSKDHRQIELGTYNSKSQCEAATKQMVANMRSWLSANPQVLHALSSDGRHIGLVCEKFYSE